jgi:hypothetical protein
MLATARRSLVTLAAGVVLAVPVLATPVASAAQERISTERVTWLLFHDRGRVAGHTGNTRTVFIGVDKAADGTVSLRGTVYDQKCAPGVHIKASDFGRELELCPVLHTWLLSSANAQLTHMDAVQLTTAHVVGDVTLTSLWGTGTPRVEHIDLTYAGTGEIRKVREYQPAPGIQPVNRVRETTVSGTFGPMTLEDNPRDNQLSHFQSRIVYRTD